jgi:NitT/TauT family transport system substrate-binding protein
MSNSCIRIGHLKIVDHLILGIADLLMETKEISLTHSSLETFAMNSWESVCDGLTDGQLNGAFLPAPMAMELFSQGLDIKLLMLTHRAGSIIVKSRASGMNNRNEFKGKTFLVPSELCLQNMFLHRILSSLKLKFSTHDSVDADVTREVVSPFIMPEMLENDSDNDIAGFAVAEPFGSQAILGGKGALLCTSQSLWKDHPCCVFVLKQAFIEKNPAAVEEIVSTFTQIAQFIEDNKSHQVIQMAQSFLSQTEKVTQNALLKTGIKFDPELLIPDIDALNTIQDYMKDTMDVLKNKIEMTDLVDSSFILRANPKKNLEENL